MNDFVSVDVFFPGAPYPVRLREFQDFHGPRRFAVYRPALSARGNTINASRLVRDSLADAWRLAHKPIPAAVLDRWRLYGRTG